MFTTGKTVGLAEGIIFFHLPFEFCLFLYTFKYSVASHSKE